MERVGVAVEGRNRVMGMLVDRAVEHDEEVVMGMLLTIALESVAIQLNDVVLVRFLSCYLGNPCGLRVKRRIVQGEQDSWRCYSCGTCDHRSGTKSIEDLQCHPALRIHCQIQEHRPNRSQKW